jgi:hypothetical protein
MARKPFTPSANRFDVGYGRPPKSTRWGPGQSGNPSGSRKRRKNTADILDEILDEKFFTSNGGRRQKMSAREILLRVVRAAGMKGRISAISLLLKQEAANRAGMNSKQENERPPTITDGMTAIEAAALYAAELKKLREGR